MGKVLYDNKLIEPAPFVGITKQYQNTGDSEHVGSVYNITVNGTLVAFAGSPDSNGVFHTGAGTAGSETVSSNSRLSSIQRKQEALRDLFKTEGKQFEVQALDGSQPVKCNPRVLDINFQEGVWFDRCDYTISLQADVLYPQDEDNFPEYLSSASESWSIDTDETPENEDLPRTYRLTHTVNAQGKRFYDNTGTLEKEAWKWARDWVHPKLGFDTVIALSSGVNNLPDYYGGYNHLRSENIDEKGGSYSVTETWIIASGTALETFEVSSTESIDSPFTNVSINGNIQGLEERNDDLDLIVTSKYDNANTKFNSIEGKLLTRAQNITGYTLNITPRTKTVGRNKAQGFINYNYEYDTRPSTIVSGAKTENINIVDVGGGDIFAAIPILERNGGPVLQDMETKEATTRQLTIDLIMEPPSLGSKSQTDLQNAFFNQKPDVSDIIDAANPSNNGFSTTFSSQPQETWNPLTGQYSLSRNWTYE